MYDKKKLEKLLKAFANNRRLSILSILKREEEQTVGEISRSLKVSIKATSKHLGRLFAVDILEREQRGFQVYYSLQKNLPDILRGILKKL